MFTAERTMQMRVQDEWHQAELSRLAQEARPQRLSWLSRQGRRLACELGYLLVALGSRLEPDEPTAAPATSK
jgi:hypothetical protein